MRKKNRDIIVKTGPLNTLVDYQRNISAGTTVSRILFEEKLKKEHIQTLTPFIQKISAYRGFAKGLFKIVIFPTKNLYPEANPEKNNLENILLESSMRPLAEVKIRNHIGAVNISLDVLKKHKIVSKSCKIWDEKSKDAEKVMNLIKTFNKHLQRFDLKITFALAVEKTPGISFHFERVATK